MSAETITAEITSIVNAARAWERGEVGALDWLRDAVKAHVIASIPQECRPPSDAKDGSLWWLTKEGTSKYEPLLWLSERWRMFGSKEPFSPQRMATAGWTVLSECIFHGEHGATREALIEFVKATWELSRLELASAALRHFKSPKLRDLSDTVVMSMAVRIDLVDRPQRLLQFARAIEAHIRGLDVS